MAEDGRRSDDGRQKLNEVIEQIKSQPRGLEAFAQDPIGYLKRKGINTDGLTLSTTPSPERFGGELTDADLSMVAGGGCFSLGYYGCYSEG